MSGIGRFAAEISKKLLRVVEKSVEGHTVGHGKVAEHIKHAADRIEQEEKRLAAEAAGLHSKAPGGHEHGPGQGGASGSGARPAAPKRDAGLSDRGYRPAPGERAMTREEWRAANAHARAAQSVAGADRPLENPRPSAATKGHGHGRHGHQTTEAQQAERVCSGLSPEGMPGNSPSRASRFHSPQAEAEALGRARSTLEGDLRNGDVTSYPDPVTGHPTYTDPANGEPVRHRVVVATDHPDGFGSSYVPQRVNGPGTPAVLDPAGNRIPLHDPTPLPHARVVFEYVASAHQWRPITYHPEP